jgi:hypothetical protein
VHSKNFANAMMKLYEMSDKERLVLSRKVKKYAGDEFNHQKTISMWNDTMMNAIQEFKNRKNWDIEEIQ